jgi:membrane protein
VTDVLASEQEHVDRGHQQMPLRTVTRVVRRTLSQAWADRILGLAAEAGFWALLSLTPLLLVLGGAVGYLEPVFGEQVASRVEREILDAAGTVLAPSAVDQLLRPVLDDVLRHGHGQIISIGFLLAVWTGSTAMSTYVNTITIAYAMRDVRSAVRTRVLAFGLYLGALVIGSFMLPLLVTAPGWIVASSPARIRHFVEPLVSYGYWPIIAVLCIGVLAALYRLAVPVRGRWWRDLPGAIAATVMWLAGSALLRLYLSFAVSHSPAYGVLSAPVAVLLFLYVTALAVLLGAELNSQIDRLQPDPRTHAARRKAASLQLRRLQH